MKKCYRRMANFLKGQGHAVYSRHVLLSAAREVQGIAVAEAHARVVARASSSSTSEEQAGHFARGRGDPVALELNRTTIVAPEEGVDERLWRGRWSVGTPFRGGAYDFEHIHHTFSWGELLHVSLPPHLLEGVEGASVKLQIRPSFRVEGAAEDRFTIYTLTAERRDFACVRLDREEWMACQVLVCVEGVKKAEKGKGAKESVERFVGVRLLRLAEDMSVYEAGNIFSRFTTHAPLRGGHVVLVPLSMVEYPLYGFSSFTGSGDAEHHVWLFQTDTLNRPGVLARGLPQSAVDAGRAEASVRAAQERVRAAQEAERLARWQREQEAEERRRDQITQSLPPALQGMMHERWWYAEDGTGGNTTG